MLQFLDLHKSFWTKTLITLSTFSLTFYSPLLNVMRSKVLLGAVFLLPLAATKLLPRTGTKNQNNVKSCSVFKVTQCKVLMTPQDWYDDDEDDEVSIANRSTDSEGNSTEVKHMIHNLFARAAGSASRYDFCIGDALMVYKAPAYPAGKERFDCEDWEKCENFNVKMVSRSLSSRTDERRGGGETSTDMQETENSKSNEAKRNQIKKPNKKTKQEGFFSNRAYC